MKKILCSLWLIILISGCAVATSPNDHRQSTQQHVTEDGGTRSIESAFSPEAGGEALVLKVINAAKTQLLLAAYSFTSPVIVKALISAHKRGVDVRIVVDDKGNRGKANIAALNLVVNAGIAVRTNAAYAIHHDKYLIVDHRHIQTGSFNYSKAAAKSNSENVLVVWNDANLAASFSKHWQSRWDQSSIYLSRY